MPQLRDFLSRFRPAGAPGAARAAVPADHYRQVAAELEPVLVLLDDTDRACAQLIAAARREAGQVVAAARADAAVLAAAARRDAAAARQQSVQQALAAARAEAADIMSGAARQAAAVRELASQRGPALTQRAVALVWSLQDADQAPPPRRDELPGAPGGPA